jgi:hypothetical protein
MRTEQQDGLLAEFVGTFGKLYELAEYADIYPIVAELAVGEPDPLGQTHWRPATVETESCCLDSLYAKLPVASRLFTKGSCLRIVGRRWI